ncbi:MAG TPA: leucine zipper domain-containing protein [Thermodesulfobacteriota bacterium]|nr:leucine zipper domain-containing protein [Thermodesulfobacteriota bacterium]
MARKTYYFWWNRYQEYGFEGVKVRSRKPLHSPRATKTKIIEKVIYLRQHYYFGPLKIQMYLLRYHDIRITPPLFIGFLKDYK